MIDNFCGSVDAEVTPPDETDIADTSNSTAQNSATQPTKTVPKTTKSNSPESSSSPALSVDGRCGSFNGRTCFDSDFGDCCKTQMMLRPRK